MGVPFPRYRGFSFALETLDDPTLDWVLSEYSSCLLDLFLDRFGVSLRSSSEGVVEQLAALRDASLPFRAIWSPGLGGLLQALQSDSIPMSQNAAATLLMQAGSAGVAGSWRANFAREATLRWDHWLYGNCERIEVSNSGTSANIVVSLGGHARGDRLSRAEPGSSWTGVGPEPLRFVDTDHGSVVVLPARALNWTPCEQLRTPLCEEIDESDYRPLVDSFGALESYSPPYYSWIARVVRGVALVDSPQNKLQSASQDECCGIIYLSNNHDPLLLGEMLVHEASHQYYFIATRHGSAVDPADDMQFYSPFARRLRPVERILLGFHAFANVYLYYESVLKSGSCRSAFCIEQMAKIRRDLEIVTPLIRGTDKLTDIGNALAQPLLGALDGL
jgi:HEXXH motif-containing protein